MKKLSFLLSLLLVLTLLVPLGAAPASAADAVCFVSDSGTDLADGSSPENAVATLNAAYEALPQGGTIVLCGPVTLSRSSVGSNYLTPETATGEYTYTSVWNGTDYRTTANAALLSDMWIYFNSPHIFDHLTIRVQKSTSLYCCNGNKFVVGSDVECVRDGSSNYIGITAGRNDDKLQDAAHGGDLTISSGSWQMIRGGTRNNAKLNCINEGGPVVTINGGDFYGVIFTGGDGTIKGNAATTINGGTFHGALNPLGTGKVEGSVTLTINGGDFLDVTTLNFFASATGSADGLCTLKINGGTFHKSMDLFGDRSEDHSKAAQGVILDASGWETPMGSLLEKAEGFSQVLYDKSKVPAETEPPVTEPPVTQAPETEPPKETQAPVTGAPETKAPAKTAPVTSAPETGETAAPGGSGVPVYAVAILIASLCGCVISALLFFRSRSKKEN